MAKAKQDASGSKAGGKRTAKGTGSGSKGSTAKAGVRRRLGRGLESLISAPVEIEAKPVVEDAGDDLATGDTTAEAAPPPSDTMSNDNGTATAAPTETPVAPRSDSAQDDPKSGPAPPAPDSAQAQAQAQAQSSPSSPTPTSAAPPTAPPATGSSSSSSSSIDAVGGRRPARSTTAPDAFDPALGRDRQPTQSDLVVPARSAGAAAAAPATAASTAASVPPVPTMAASTQTTQTTQTSHGTSVGQPASGPASESAPESADDAPSITMLPLSQLRANPKQPRRDFDEAALETLASSIRSAGVMQPIVVRPHPGSAYYEIVAGERRFRAATLIGLARIPAVVHEVDDRTAAEWALVENLQREDLNPIERGEAFRRLIDEFGLTHQEVAETVGLERSSVTNHLRLVDLDPATRDAVRAGELGMGHGRALLAIANLTQREALAKAAIAQSWSVRELERRIRAAKRPPADAPSSAIADPLAADPVRLHMDDLERRLGEVLGTRVAIQTGQKKGTGRLSISFYSIDQFEGILERLGYRGD